MSEKKTVNHKMYEVAKYVRRLKNDSCVEDVWSMRQRWKCRNIHEKLIWLRYLCWNIHDNFVETLTYSKRRSAATLDFQ